MKLRPARPRRIPYLPPHSSRNDERLHKPCWVDAVSSGFCRSVWEGNIRIWHVPARVILVTNSSRARSGAAMPTPAVAHRAAQPPQLTASAAPTASPGPGELDHIQPPVPAGGTRNRRQMLGLAGGLSTALELSICPTDHAAYRPHVAGCDGRNPHAPSYNRDRSIKPSPTPNPYPGCDSIDFPTALPVRSRYCTRRRPAVRCRTRRATARCPLIMGDGWHRSAACNRLEGHGIRKRFLAATGT